MTKVFYTTSWGQHDVIYTLDELRPQLKKTSWKTDFPSDHCPASSAYWRDTYDLSVPFDLEFAFDPINQEITTNNVPDFVYDQNSETTMWKDTNVEFQMLNNVHFWTNSKSDIFLEVFPSWYVNQLGLRGSVGKFNFVKWQRPIHSSFQFYTDGVMDVVKIPADMPMTHVRFSKSVNLEFVDELPDNIVKQTQRRSATLMMPQYLKKINPFK